MKNPVCLRITVGVERIRQIVYGEQLRVGEATHRLGNFKIVAPPAALICLRITKELLECRFLGATLRQYGSGAPRQVD